MDNERRLSPEVRLVRPGEVLRLCQCGQSPTLPDCPPGCTRGLTYHPPRAQRLLLCRCGRAARMPWCDGRHATGR